MAYKNEHFFIIYVENANKNQQKYQRALWITNKGDEQRENQMIYTEKYYEGKNANAKKPKL